ARIDSRGGNVPRRLRGVVLPAESAPPRPGTPLRVDGSEVGEVTSAAWSPALRAPVALAYVGRAVEPPADAEVGDVSAHIRQLPLVGSTVG
ncbi:MAG TPA: glycine cleavage T C-terminal barrel domain-containing protein, partial [Acidimicrobiales bacterium]